MSFWLPEHQPKALEKRVKKPPKRPTSPMTGAPLKLKDLTTIKLPAMASNAKGSSSSASPARAWQCSVTRKSITVQAAVVHKETGALMLHSAAKELGYGASELIQLKRQTTGFAGTGKVEAKVWAPGIN